MSDNTQYNLIVSLIHSARQLPYNMSRLAMLEQAARHADACGDDHLGWYARRNLMDTCNHLGLAERVLDALTWCFACSARDPAEFGEEELLWPSKWVVENITSFPSIPREQAERLIQDVELRFARNNASLRPIKLYRARIALALGQPHQHAQDLLHHAQLLPRDEYSDCLACETNGHMLTLLHMGQLHDALLIADPILRGDQTCMEVPHVTFASLLIPLLRDGQLQRAKKLQKKHWTEQLKSPLFTRPIAEHLHFLTLIGDLKRATLALEHHLDWANASLNADTKLHFMLATECFARRAARDADTLPLRLPPSLNLPRSERGVPLDALATWAASHVEQLVSLYTRRDQHDGVARTVADLRDLHRTYTSHA
jgi:hypothetical protein